MWWVLWASQMALASGPAAGQEDPQRFVVVLVALVGVAYLVSKFMVDWLEKRFLFVSSFPFILLGAGLGHLAIFRDLASLGPILALAAGWVGLVYGMELNIRALLSLDEQGESAGRGASRIALFEVLGSGVMVAVVAHWFFVSGIVPDVQHPWLAAGVMGCAGAAGSASAIDLVTERYQVNSPLVTLLRRTAVFGDLTSILMFGWLFCYFHQGENLAGYQVNASLWILVTLGLGGSLGVLFSVFLGDDESENSRFLALVGIIAFASGAAFFLNLSLLTVNLVLGIVVANSIQDGEGVRETLSSTRRPMALVLLFFAGALWVPPWAEHGFSWEAVWPSLAVTACYVLMRIGGKVAGCWLGAVGQPMRNDLSRGLLAQGEEALAMALSLKLVFEGPAVDLAYTAILGSVMVHELIAPRLLKALLVDAGDIRTEREAESPPEQISVES